MSQTSLQIAAVTSCRFSIYSTTSSTPQPLITNTYSQYKVPQYSEYDHLSVIYRDPSNRQMCDSAIKPTSPAYKFETRSDLLLDSYPTLRFRGCRYAFETFEEYERSVGLGTLLEQRASMGKHTYTGRVAVVPVPGTYSKKAKLWMAYHLQLSVDKNSRSPALVVGDSIIINFNPNGIDLKTAWKGRITEAVDATSIGQLNVTVKRPHDKGAVLPLDSEEHSVLTVKDFTTMEHSSVLRNWPRNNSKKSVVIYTNNDEKGCKRLMNNFSKLKVPHKLRDTSPAKAAALKAGTELLLMNNFTQLKRSELFKNIDAGQWTQARQILVTYLRDYQLSAFLEMEDNGLYENTACVIGPSGSGKSYLALTIAVAYKEYRIKKAAMRAAKEACIEVEPEAKPSSPKDNPAPPKPEEDSPETYTKQPGRITFCGIQNDTVDEVYRVLSTVTPKLMNEMKMPPKLVLRIHSSSSEIDAVVAMSRLFFDRDEKELPYYYNPNIEVIDGLPVSLLGTYLTHYRGTSDTSLCNRRMKEVDGSAANCILELANNPDFPRSPEVLATFTSGELTDLEDKLTPMLRAREQLLMNGDVMDNDIKRAVKSAAKTGHYALLEKAAANVANIMPSVLLFSPSRNVHYVTHAVFLEEAGRASDAEIAGYFTHYWHAQLRMFIGSTNQLPPKNEWEDYMMEIHRNARVPKLSDDGAEAWDLDVYKPSHKVLDVSDRTWESTLRKLFPQATEQDYFKNLYGSLRSGAKLFLICFRHNELPCTSNVLTHRTQMPELCDDLRIAMQNSPYIFMLIRSSGVDSEVESIVEAWKELTEYDPMSVIYKNLNNPQMCDSGIKPTSELPKFTASTRYVFETGCHYS